MQVYDNDYEWTDQGNVPPALNAWIAEVAPGAKDEFLPSIFFVVLLGVQRLQGTGACSPMAT